jgi:hypothetical protein
MTWLKKQGRQDYISMISTLFISDYTAKANSKIQMAILLPHLNFRAANA